MSKFSVLATRIVFFQPSSLLHFFLHYPFITVFEGKQYDLSILFFHVLVKKKKNFVLRIKYSYFLIMYSVRHSTTAKK